MTLIMIALLVFGGFLIFGLIRESIEKRRERKRLESEEQDHGAYTDAIHQWAKDNAVDQRTN